MASKKMSDFAEEVVSLLPRLMRGVFKKHSDELGKGTISVPQYICMNLILVKGSVMMKDIASGLHISLPAATGLIDRLYIMGFVRRVNEPSDRRVIKIALTDKGKKIVGQVKEQRRSAIIDVFSQLSENERDHYLKILRKIVKVLDKDKAKK